MQSTYPVQNVSSFSGAPATGTPVHSDLATAPIHCDDEPIHIPGSIQRHGFFLLLDANGETIAAASENVEEFLGVPLKLVLGASLSAVLERELLAALRSLTTLDETASVLTYLGSFHLRGNLFSVVTHRLGDERVIEFECLDRLVSPELMNCVITNFVGALNKLGTESELLHAIIAQVKELTGFNRVLLYRFDEFGHGTVMAQVTDGVLPSYLGLRFPASDIPRQARELYLLNTVRIIPDANYTPSPLRAPAARTVKTLDLSMSLLRSVSPVHLEYMRNMGTMSSMSISIVCEGKLWGLISGHHSEPHSVPYLVRSACDLLTRMVSSQLMAFRIAARLEKMVQFHAVQRTVLTEMAAKKDYVSSVIHHLDFLAQVTDAAGTALVIDGQVRTGGATPGESAILRLAGWMDARPELQLFETRQLCEHLEWANEIRDLASGLLVIRISDVRQSYLMWFRPEIVNVVEWAGEAAQLGSKTDGLHPRKSFTAWQELVRGQSDPWSEVEIESARDFRSAVMTISLKRAEEAAEISDARFHQLTHALPNPVWTADDHGHLTYVNEKWRTLGFGDHGCWYEHGHLFEEDEARCAELWQTAVAQGTAFEAEVRFRTGADGTERWNLVRSIPFVGVNRGRAGWVGTCIDLTDRRERELAIRMAEKLALTGKMTSVIAHEINNPLEAITNLLYLLSQELNDNRAAQNYIGMAGYELERISGITKQTLRWSRESVQRPEHGTAGPLFRDALRLFAGKIRNRQVLAEIEAGDDVPFYGVIGQLRQVLTNLVSNALDAVPTGGRIAFSAATCGEVVELRVIDNGSGMSEEIQRQIFQPFYSTKGDLGTGLGLYISQEIMERHGGALLVHSVPGAGTTMRIQLPIIAV